MRTITIIIERNFRFVKRKMERICTKNAAPAGTGAAGWIQLAGSRGSLRSRPQKKRATVPGPVWLPMVVPT